MDAFYIAFRIPNLFRELLAEGALGNAFTKVYTDCRERSPELARSVLEKGLFVALVLGALLSLAGIVFADQLVALMTLFQKQDASEQSLLVANAVGLTKVLFPFIGFMIIGAIAAGALHNIGRFFLSSIASVALNLGFILGAIFLSNTVASYFPNAAPANVDPKYFGLAVGVLIGGASQSLIQVTGVRKYFSLGSIFKRPHLTPEIATVFSMMLPMVLGASAGQINVLINTNFAASLQAGAITWLQAAFRLVQLPIGLFGVAIGIVALPTLTREQAKKDKGQKHNLDASFFESLNLVLWLMIPCMLFIYTQADQVVLFLYQGGKFGANAVLQTSNALRAYSTCLVSYGLIKLFTSVYYSAGKTRYPMFVSLASVGINFAINYEFVLKRSYGHVGIAQALTFTLTFNALCLALGLRFENFRAHLINLLKDFGVLLLLSAFLITLIPYFQSQFEFDTLYKSEKLSALVNITLYGTLILFSFGSVFALRFKARQKHFKSAEDTRSDQHDDG